MILETVSANETGGDVMTLLILEETVTVTGTGIVTETVGILIPRTRQP